MGFAAWLETADIPKFAAWMKDGTVVFYLKGVRYVYHAPAFWQEKWRYMLRKNFPGAAWKVLNQLKKVGEQLEPAPEPPPPPEPKQKTLW